MMDVDANDVIAALLAQVSELSRQNAMLVAQVRALERAREEVAQCDKKS